MNTPLYQYAQLLARYLKPQRLRVIGLSVLLFGGIGLQLLNPQVIRFFIDTAQSGGPQRELWLAAALFIAFALGHQALTVLADTVADAAGWTATNALRKDLALHCLRLDMPFHKTHTPGELIERIDGDVTALANFFAQFAGRVAGNGLMVLGILALLYREDVGVGAGLTLYVAVTLAALFAIQRFAVARWAAFRQAEAEQFGFLEERIAGASDIRAVGAQAHVLRQLIGLMRAAMRTGRAAFVTQSLAYSLSNLLFVIGYAVGLALAVYLVTQRQASLGAAYLVVAYISMMHHPLHNLREQAQDFQQAAASLQRVTQLFDLKPRMRERPDSDQLSVKGGLLSIEFSNVSFAYDGSDHVLREVSFHLQPGRVLGVLGRTGSGKTTLTRLLFRLYDVTEGAVRLNNVDVRDLPLAALRTRVGLVTQEVQLFHASLRDNLTFFDPRITDEQIERALRALSLWDWVTALPEGLDTLLGAGGQGFSAGEAQLLAFTRVFLRDPGLVILDEASSRLDPATERRLERAIDHLLAGRAALVIAHRLQTVQRADDILILDEGRVAEFGPRAALAADPNSRFAQLLQTGLMEVLA
jgi:ABC-type multidrug transport system fused ATPase/permease subunit